MAVGGRGSVMDCEFEAATHNGSAAASSTTSFRMHAYACEAAAGQWSFWMIFMNATKFEGIRWPCICAYCVTGLRLLPRVNGIVALITWTPSQQSGRS